MDDSSSYARSQQQTDANHLNLLSIFHFISGGMSVFGILFLVFHYAMMHTFFSIAEQGGKGGNGPPMEFLAVFKWFYLLMGLMFLSFAVLNLLSGVFLRQRRHRMFSIVVGALNCIKMPLGTILGIFTIIVLTRESVHDLYDDPNPPPG